MQPLGSRIYHFVICGLDCIFRFFFICCFLLVIITIMADDPAPKRVRLAIGTVCEHCEACGKHFDTSDGFDKH